ncbi:MAG: (d)CMP kinase [Candidatus Dormibacteria bacterium]
MTAPVVTVDGPAGSGKSTLGRALARTFGLPLVDTGLFYRGVTVAAVRRGVDPSDSAALEDLLAHTHIEIGTDPWTDGEALAVDGLDATAMMRDPAHARLLARLSRTPLVREVLRARQRALARDGAVAVGRDCGTVVFVDAPVKFYLDAPETVRRARRAQQLSLAGSASDGAAMAEEIDERDRSDSSRSVAPLRPAVDAHVIDTSTVSVAEMVAFAEGLCRAAGIGER